jgi:hypothetical protein
MQNDNRKELRAMKWTGERAAEYMNSYGTVVAVNYVPSYCYNYIQIWYEFREDVINRELGWARECGLNSLRMFLPLFAFQKDGKWDEVKQNFTRFMDLAGRLGFSVMVTFQPNYMRIEQPDKPQTPWVKFRPGMHQNHWQYPNSDFSCFADQPGALEDMYSLLEDIMTTYNKDRRVIAWDLWNETSSNERETLESIFIHARKINPSQPLTACWEAYDISDIVTFHNYTMPGKVIDLTPRESSLDFIPELERALSFNRPILCTECLARTLGNTFEAFLPYFAKHRIGFYFWGLCAGSAQYHFPWGWPEGSPEPRDWFHCILYPNGEPYREKEILMLKDFKWSIT